MKTQVFTINLQDWGYINDLRLLYFLPKDDRDLPFHVGILASTIGLSIICLGLFAFCLRYDIIFLLKNEIEIHGNTTTLYFEKLCAFLFVFFLKEISICVFNFLY